MIIDNADHIHNLNPTMNIFYRGVVEDNNDENEEGGTLGRCRVRILGIHTNNSTRSGLNQGVPTDELPWAELMVPNSGGGLSGIGVSSVPLKGTWVWVFLDAGDWNKPVIVGTIYGVNKKESPGNEGFFDPDSMYPLKDRLNEPDINRIASNRKFDETLIKTVRDDLKEEAVPTATGESWDEILEATSKTVYPNNTVIETPGGSIIEYDSTPDNERIHFFHKSGTFWEIQDKGDYQLKVVDNRFEIVNKDYNVFIKGKHSTSVQLDVERKYDANETILVGGEHLETVKGSVTKEYEKTMDLKVKGAGTFSFDSFDLNAKGATNFILDGGLTIDSGPSMTLKSSVIKLN